VSQKAKILHLYDIDKDKVEKLVLDLKQIRNNISLTKDVSSIENFDIIINATPLGLKEKDPLPFNTVHLRKEQIVCDLIYKKTPLLEQAGNKGCVTLNGLGMLLWQGIFAFELWTGKRPPVEVMRSALLNAS